MFWRAASRAMGQAGRSSGELLGNHPRDKCIIRVNSPSLPPFGNNLSRDKSLLILFFLEKGFGGFIYG